MGVRVKLIAGQAAPRALRLAWRDAGVQAPPLTCLLVLAHLITSQFVATANCLARRRRRLPLDQLQRTRIGGARLVARVRHQVCVDFRGGDAHQLRGKARPHQARGQSRVNFWRRLGVDLEQSREDIWPLDELRLGCVVGREHSERRMLATHLVLQLHLHTLVPIGNPEIQLDGLELCTLVELDFENKLVGENCCRKRQNPRG